MLEYQRLIDRAIGRTGLDDFGEKSWEEALGVLVHCLNTEARLNPMGERAFAGQLIAHLVNRLKIEQCYRENPEIEDEQIKAPLFGVGLPRTGSTAFSYLMSCDTSRRYLRVWEANSPCPPPIEATEDKDPRIQEAQAGLDYSRRTFPDVIGMLPRDATGPHECTAIWAFDFRSELFPGSAYIPSYTNWLLSTDMASAYRYHKRVLKLLQWHRPPNRWWLKSPSHMTHIEALHEVYPDARFVMTHRRMEEVLPSLCALKEALSNPLTGYLDRKALGQHDMDLWEESLRRLILFREQDGQFVDISFNRLQTNPIETLTDCYLQLGDKLTSPTVTNMLSWWEENSSDRRISHPTPDVYGLADSVLHERFAFYNERFAPYL